MEETEDRKARDARGIWWLLDNLTEDGEMESFSVVMPGSFKWRMGSRSVEECVGDHGRHELEHRSERAFYDTTHRCESPRCPSSCCPTFPTVQNDPRARHPDL